MNISWSRVLEAFEAEFTSIYLQSHIDSTAAPTKKKKQTIYFVDCTVEAPSFPWVHIVAADALCSGIEDPEFPHGNIQSLSASSALMSRRKSFDQKTTLINCVVQEILKKSQEPIRNNEDLMTESATDVIISDISIEWSSLTTLQEFLIRLPVSLTKKMKEKKRQIVENVMVRLSAHGTLEEIIHKFVSSCAEKTYYTSTFQFTFGRVNSRNAYTHLDSRLTNFERRLEFIEERILGGGFRFLADDLEEKVDNNV